MCLLDTVVEWDDTTIHAVSESHKRAENPLRHSHGLHAVHLAEYGAQAMAVHGALMAQRKGEETARDGQLVSLRDVRLEVEYVDEGSAHLDVYAERLYADGGGAQYAFRVLQAGHLLASGRAAVIYTPS